MASSRSTAGLVRVLVAGFALSCAGCANADAPAAAPPDSTPARATNLAVIETIEGAPADSLARREFQAALRGAFARTSLEMEGAAAHSGADTMGASVPNRFTLLEGSDARANPEAYRVQLTLEWLKPPAARGSAVRGKTARPSAAAETTASRAFVAVLVWPPGVDPAVVRLAAAGDTVTFRVPPIPRQAHAASVGRNAGLLVLERLHQLSGDLAEDARLKLDRAGRRRDVGGGPIRR